MANDRSYLNRYALVVILLPICFYALQGPIIHFKLKYIDSVTLDPKLTSRVCNEKICKEEYSLSVPHRFLLLGHVLRTFRAYDSVTHDEIFPINQQRGDSYENWINLNVYEFEKPTNIIIKAVRPKSALLQGFIGIYPRSSESSDILSIPDISPTVSMTSQLLANLLLLILFASAILHRNVEPKNVIDTKWFLGLVASIAFVNFCLTHTISIPCFLIQKPELFF